MGIFNWLFGERSKESEVNPPIRVNVAHISSSPSIAIDSNDNVHIIWVDVRDECYGIYYKKLDNNGNPLTGDIKVTDAGNDYGSSSIAIDSNDNVYIIWAGWVDEYGDVDYSVDRNKIFYKKLDNNGNSLTEVIRIAKRAASPSVAIDSNDNVHIIWYDDRVNSSIFDDIYYKKLDNNGNPLSVDIEVADYVDSPAFIAVDSNDNVYISWVYKHSEMLHKDGKSYIKKFDNKGKRTEVRVANDNHPSFIAIDSNDNIHTAGIGGIRGKLSGEYDICYKKFDNNGNSLTKRIRVTDVTYVHDDVPAIAIASNNNVHIVWNSYSAGSESGFFYIYYKKLDNNGNSLTNDIKITDAKGKSWQPSIAIDSNNNAHIAWVSNSDGHDRIYYKKLDV